MAPYVKMRLTDVQAIFDAGKQIISLTAQRTAAIRERRTFDAIRLRNRINRIKSQVFDKYDIIV